MTGSINGQFGSVADCPLLYFQKNFSFDDICAMFAIADVALITPLRYEFESHFVHRKLLFISHYKFIVTE